MKFQILLLSILLTGATSQWLSRTNQNPRHRHMRRPPPRQRGPPPFLVAPFPPPQVPPMPNITSTIATREEQPSPKNQTNPSEAQGYNDVFSERMIELLKKLGELNESPSSQTSTTTTEISSESSTEIPATTPVAGGVPEGASPNQEPVHPSLRNGPPPRFMKPMDRMPTQRPTLWGNIQSMFARKKPPTPMRLQAPTAAKSLLKPQPSPTPSPSPSPTPTPSIRRFDENMEEEGAKESSTTQATPEPEGRSPMFANSRSLLDEMDDEPKMEERSYSPSSNANTLSVLAKLSPKKPIVLFMRQEGIMETHWPGADPGKVVKKYAGSTKIQFFNGTVPEDDVPPVFLAPEDTIPPRGYGKMPIPKVENKSEPPAPRPTYLPVEEQIKLLMQQREKMRLMQQKKYSDIAASESRLSSNYNVNSHTDGVRVLQVEGGKHSPDFYDQVQNSLPKGAIVESIVPYNPYERNQGHKSVNTVPGHKETTNAYRKPTDPHPQSRPFEPVRPTPIPSRPQPTPTLLRPQLPPRPVPPAHPSHSDFQTHLNSPTSLASQGIEIELPPGSNDGLISNDEIQKIVGALVGGGGSVATKDITGEHSGQHKESPPSKFPHLGGPINLHGGKEHPKIIGPPKGTPLRPNQQVPGPEEDDKFRFNLNFFLGGKGKNKPQAGGFQKLLTAKKNFFSGPKAFLGTFQDFKNSLYEGQSGSSNGPSKPTQLLGPGQQPGTHNQYGPPKPLGPISQPGQGPHHGNPNQPFGPGSQSGSQYGPPHGKPGHHLGSPSNDGGITYGPPEQQGKPVGPAIPQQVSHNSNHPQSHHNHPDPTRGQQNQNHHGQDSPNRYPQNFDSNGPPSGKPGPPYNQPGPPYGPPHSFMPPHEHHRQPNSHPGEEAHSSHQFQDTRAPSESDSKNHGPQSDLPREHPTKTSINVFSYESNNPRGPPNSIEKAKTIASTSKEYLRQESRNKKPPKYSAKAKYASQEYGSKEEYSAEKGRFSKKGTTIIINSNKAKGKSPNKPTVIITANEGDMSNVGKIIESLGMSHDDEDEKQQPVQQQQQQEQQQKQSFSQTKAHTIVVTPAPVVPTPSPPQIVVTHVQQQQQPNQQGATMEFSFDQVAQLFQTQQQQQPQQILIQQAPQQPQILIQSAPQQSQQQSFVIHQAQQPQQQSYVIQSAQQPQQYVLQQAPSNGQGQQQYVIQAAQQQPQQPQQFIIQQAPSQSQQPQQYIIHQQEQPQQTSQQFYIQQPAPPQQAQTHQMIYHPAPAPAPSPAPSPIVVPNANQPLPPVIFVPHPPTSTPNEKPPPLIYTSMSPQTVTEPTVMAHPHVMVPAPSSQSSPSSALETLIQKQHEAAVAKVRNEQGNAKPEFHAPEMVSIVGHRLTHDLHPMRHHSHAHVTPTPAPQQYVTTHHFHMTSDGVPVHSTTSSPMYHSHAGHTTANPAQVQYHVASTTPPPPGHYHMASTTSPPSQYHIASTTHSPAHYHIASTTPAPGHYHMSSTPTPEYYHHSTSTAAPHAVTHHYAPAPTPPPQHHYAQGPTPPTYHYAHAPTPSPQQVHYEFAPAPAPAPQQQVHYEMAQGPSSSPEQVQYEMAHASATAPQILHYPQAESQPPQYQPQHHPQAHLPQQLHYQQAHHPPQMYMQTHVSAEEPSQSIEEINRPQVTMDVQSFSAMKPQTVDDRVLEKVRTEEKIVWREVPSASGESTHVVPLKITTQEKSFLNPDGRREVESTVLSTEIAEELMGHQPMEGTPFMKRSGISSDSESPDRTNGKRSQPPRETPSFQETRVPKSESAFADLLKAKAEMTKMEHELHPKRSPFGQTQDLTNVFGKTF